MAGDFGHQIVEPVVRRIQVKGHLAERYEGIGMLTLGGSLFHFNLKPQYPLRL